MQHERNRDFDAALAENAAQLIGKRIAATLSGGSSVGPGLSAELRINLAVVVKRAIQTATAFQVQRAEGESR